MIKLKIEKHVTNENFQQELAKYQEAQMNNERGGYRHSQIIEMLPEPKKEIIENLLAVYITEEQWVAIRKAVIETF